MMSDKRSSTKKRRTSSACEMTTVLTPGRLSAKEVFFHDAAQHNDIARMRTLLESNDSGVHIDVKDNMGRTALQLASAEGNLETVNFLLSAGASPDTYDKHHMTAALSACWEGHVDVLEVLAMSGAELGVMNSRGFTGVHCAARNNHWQVINFLMRYRGGEALDLGAKSTREGETALHVAAASGALESVVELIAARASVHECDNHQQTALHSAARHGCTEVTSLLLSHGADVEATNANHETPALLACSGGHTSTLKVLLKAGAKIGGVEGSPETSGLWLATMNNHSDVVDTLMPYIDKEHLNVVIESTGNSLVHEAVLRNSADVITSLAKAGADINLANTIRKETPLHLAVESSRIQCVDALLMADSRYDCKDMQGSTPLELALQGDNSSIVDMLLKGETGPELWRRWVLKSTSESEQNRCRAISDSRMHSYWKTEHPLAPAMKTVLWKLARKDVRQSEWRRLALELGFTKEHITAIECHRASDRNSCYRMLEIWLHSVPLDEHPVAVLYNAFSSLGRRHLAEKLRSEAEGGQKCRNSLRCTIQ